MQSNEDCEDIIAEVEKLNIEMLNNIDQDNSELFKKMLAELKKIPNSEGAVLHFLKSIGYVTQNDDSGHAFEIFPTVAPFFSALKDCIKNIYVDYKFNARCRQLIEKNGARRVKLTRTSIEIEYSPGESSDSD